MAAVAACAYVCFAYVDMTALFVTLQERSGNNSFTHEALSLKYKLDNEFELIFVVSSPNIQLTTCSLLVFLSKTLVCKDIFEGYML